MRITTFFLWIAVSCCIGHISAQTFIRQYPAEGSFTRFFPGQDGGYFSTGWASNSTGTGSELVYRGLDSAGNIHTQFGLRDTLYKYFNITLIMPLQDGTLLIGGTSTTFGGVIQDFIRKITHSGQVLWHQTYTKNSGLVNGRPIIELPGGRLLIAAYIYSLPPAGTPKHFFVWLDAEGQALGQKDFPDTTIQSILSFTRSPSGDFHAGYTTSNAAMPYVFCRLDTTGTIQWQTGASSPWGKFIGYTPDGGFLFDEGPLVKRDSLAKIVWQSPIPLSGYFRNGYALLPDGGCYVANVMSPLDDLPATNNNVWLNVQRFDAQGNLMWKRKNALPDKLMFGALSPTPFGFLRNTNGELVFTTTQSVYHHAPPGQLFPLFIKLDSMGFLRPNRVSGLVVHDENNSCMADAGERPLANHVVRLEKAGVPPQFALTDSTGQYMFETDTGQYTVTLASTAPGWLPCAPAQTVLAQQRYDTSRVNFALKPNTACPRPAVSIGVRHLERCKTNVYTVRYSNPSPLPTDSTVIRLIKDPYLEFEQAEIAPFAQHDDTLWFAAPGLPAGQTAGWFHVRFNLSCAAEPGQTHCVEAHIYPDAYCGGTPAPGADLQVSATCTGDSLVRLRLSNTGSPGPVNWQIIRDSAIARTGSLTLPAGESFDQTFPADGSFWRIEAEQAGSHPWPVRVNAFLEGCGGLAKPGYPLQYGLPVKTAFDAFDCRENDNTLPGDAKSAIPKGYGPERYIRPDEPLEYTVQFSNDILDNVQLVHIYDTLSAALDPATLEPGASSHPYTWEILQPDILKFTFTGVNLQPEFLEPEAAYGFVKYRVRLQKNVPEINLVNCAEVVLDRRLPNYLPCADHGVKTGFIPVTVATRPAPAVNALLRVAPNPAGAQAYLHWEQKHAGQICTVLLWDTMGTIRRRYQVNGSGLTILRDALPAGFYRVEVWQENSLLANGNLMFIN